MDLKNNGGESSAFQYWCLGSGFEGISRNAFSYVRFRCGYVPAFRLGLRSVSEEFIFPITIHVVGCLSCRCLCLPLQYRTS